MKTTNLEHLMQRYITGEVTEQEKIKIEAWLDVKKTEEGTDMVLDAVDEERLFRKITASIDNVEEIKTFRPGHGRVRALFSNRWFRAAATLLILAAASYSIWTVAVKDAVHETVALHDPKKVILEDGTIVWLQEQSQLTYVNSDRMRRATLSGEALFEVAADPGRPFTISCGEVTVRVVGTSFNLKARAGGIELKVLTGKVNLSSATYQTGVDVSPHEMVVYDPGGNISKVPLDEVAVSAITERTEYNMAFRNTAMENVIARVEKKFDVAVVLVDAHVNTCRITADFTDHSLESTLKMITELLEIDYTVKRGTVTLTGKGCN